MQNEDDPFKRITVTNCWAESNLMQTLRLWREEAERREFTRIAELADYLQADELTHVKLATDWIRRLVRDDATRDELVRWGTEAVARIEGFYAEDGYAKPEIGDVHFTFLKEGGGRAGRRPVNVIGE
jgi:hypothetical protein